MHNKKKRKNRAIIILKANRSAAEISRATDEIAEQGGGERARRLLWALSDSASLTL